MYILYTIRQACQGYIVLLKMLKKRRNKLGLTQEALARKADMSYNTIIKLETNGIKDPRISSIIKVANVSDISIDKLSGRRLAEE